MAEYICADLSERPDCKVSPFWERRERVVRCRDCRYHAGTFCKLHEVMMPDPSEDDGFCAWGEERKA